MITTGRQYKHESWIRTHLHTGAVAGEEIMTMCLFHDNENSPACQINMESGLFVCFSCGARGTIKRLFKELGQRYAEPETSVEDLRMRLAALDKPQASAQLPVLSEDVLTRYAFETGYWRDERGFDSDIIAAFGLGFDIMHNVATIPLRNRDGGLIGFIRRMLEADSPIKYMYPKGFKRQRELFGSWLLQDTTSDLVVLCEGAVDAMSIWQAGFPAVAQYGSSTSPEQVRLLRMLGFGQIVLFMDRDKAGKKAVLAAQGLSSHVRNGVTKWDYDERRDLRRGFIVTKAAYDNDMPNDPGAMDANEIIKAIASAVPLR